MSQLPQTRNSDIIVQELGDELLIYDLRNHTAYSLNETSKIVYQACCGTTNFDELKRRYKYDDDLIYLALDELNAKSLLENYSADNFPGMSRREVIRKVGLASMIALPVIASLVAPRAANAASSGLANGSACTNATASSCASGNCSGTKNICCTRVNGSADNVPCTSINDCCLPTTTSICANGRCCRRQGATAGFAPSGDPSICCSGVCNYSGANNTGPCICT